MRVRLTDVAPENEMATIKQGLKSETRLVKKRAGEEKKAARIAARSSGFAGCVTGSVRDIS